MPLGVVLLLVALALAAWGLSEVKDAERRKGTLVPVAERRARRSKTPPKRQSVLR